MSTHVQLSQPQRSVLQQALQSQLDALQRQSGKRLDGLSQADHATAVIGQDADDATQRAGDREVEDIVSDIDSGEFAALRAALLRVQSADYGVCVDCGTFIPFARLEAEPQALLCAICAAYRESHP